ncbi:MAG: hypothetical protein GC168_09220 [Candidatus Hydrogenedens sp.]|nr:hypothetical protein [Candidatus Hydrogenedens sp.]
MHQRTRNHTAFPGGALRFWAAVLLALPAIALSSRAQDEPVTDAVARAFLVYTGAAEATPAPTSVAAREFTVSVASGGSDPAPKSAAAREFTVSVGANTAETPPRDAVAREFTVLVGDPAVLFPPNDAVAREFTVLVGDPAVLFPPDDAVAREFTVYIPQPDLEATSFSYTGVVDRGMTLDLTWGVRNNGPKDAGSGWDDCVYLSASATDLQNALPLICEPSPESLTAGTGYGRTAEAVVPEEIDGGTYYLVFKTDGGEAVGEDNELNNTVVRGPFSIANINEGEPQRVLPELDVIFVSTEFGSDDTGFGTLDAPLKGLTLAVNHAATYASGARPVEVRVSSGVYDEAFTLPTNVKLFGANPFDPSETVLRPPPLALKDNGNTVVYIGGTADSALRDLTISLENSKGVTDATLVMIDGADVAVDNVVLEGADASGSLGMMIAGVGASDARITRTTFRGLDAGAMTSGAAPVLTRNTFESVAGDAITVLSAKGAGADLTPQLGDAADGGTGYNYFEDVGGYFINNESQNEVQAEQNDWGIYEEAAIGEQMFGAVGFVPFLGQAVVVPTLFVTVLNADTNAPVASAEVRVSPGFIQPVRGNDNGVYTITYVTPGVYTLQVNAAGYFPKSSTASVTGSASAETTVMLVPDGTLAGSLPVSQSGDQNANGVLELGELLRIIQFYNVPRFRCAAGTEDGYAVGPGDTYSCRSHTADYNPTDWRLSLSETLRAVQMFNLRSYTRCESAEDGYCPGG